MSDTIQGLPAGATLKPISGLPAGATVKPIGASAPQLDPTTAGQPNSLAPAFHPTALTPALKSDMSAEVNHPLQDVAVGGIRSLANHVMQGPLDANGQPLLNKLPFSGAENKPPDPITQNDPNSGQQAIGSAVENMGEYALPAASLEKSMVKGGSSMLGRMAAQGGVNAGVSALHGERDPAHLAVDAGLGAMSPAISEGAGAAQAATKSPISKFFLSGLAKNTPADTAAGLNVPEAVGDLGISLTKGGLASKAASGAAQAGNDATTALQNYSGPNFDARPAIKMLEDAKATAVAQGHPKPYLDAIDELTNQIKSRPTLGPNNTPTPSRTNPANLGLQKFQDTIARVQNKSSVAPDVANDAVAKLNAPLNAQVPGYAAASGKKAALTSAASQLNAPSTPNAGGFKALLMKYGPEAAGALLGGGGGGAEGAVLGAGLGAATQGFGKLATSTLGRTTLNQAAQGTMKSLAAGAGGAAKTAAAVIPSLQEPVRVVSPTGQSGTMQRWEALEAQRHGWQVVQ